MGLNLYSTAFDDRGRLPVRFTGDGADISPPIFWVDSPPQTQSMALFCLDPDAPRGTWYHWAVFDIPPTTTMLSEGLPTREKTDTIRQAINDFGRWGYGGPCPPPSHGPHRYLFRLFALTVSHLSVPSMPRAQDIETALRPHTLAQAEIMATYGRSF